MAIDYQQTDTVAPNGEQQECSATAVVATAISRLCSVGGTPGSAAAQIGGAAWDAGVSGSFIMFEFTPAAGVTWDAGDFVVRLNVTGAIANAQWTATYVCRLNSSGTNQATIGSLTGQTTSVATTGVKTHTVSGAAQTPGVGDKVYIVLVLTAITGNNKIMQFTPDQLITSPFTAPAEDVTLDKWMQPQQRPVSHPGSIVGF